PRPKRSVRMPKYDEKKVLASGTWTLPPSPSAANTRLASASSDTVSDSEKPWKVALPVQWPSEASTVESPMRRLACITLSAAPGGAGVPPNAAYRHFASRQALLQAVRAAALARLALAIEAELAGIGRRGRPAAFARASLRAVGTGYLRFALDETGLFRTAFAA